MALFWWPGRTRDARFAVAVITVYQIAIFVLEAKPASALILWAISTAIAAPTIWTTLRASGSQGWAGCAVLLMSVSGWMAAATMAWNAGSLGTLFKTATPYAIPAVVALTVGGSTILMSWAFMRDPVALARERWVDALAAVLFAVAAMRKDISFVGDDHHVSFFLGPVEMVRQGGLMLWNTPSQYGFLNIWVMAHLPFGDGYSRFVFTNAALMFASATILYVVLRLTMRGVVGAFAALAATLAAIFLLSGIWFTSLGPEHYPSVGAMRFIWVYVLVAIALATYVWPRLLDRLLFAGSVAWILGSTWSAESAIYSAAIWLPSAAACIVQREGPRSALRYLAQTVGVLLGCMLLLEAVYLVRYDHAPDWRAFVEYGFVYNSGLGWSPLHTNGTMWILSIVFAVGLAVCAVLLRRGSPAFPAAYAAAAAQWSTASYFVLRSHDNNGLNLAPVQLLALGVFMYLCCREAVDPAVALIPRLIALPLATLATGLCFGASNLPNQVAAGAWLHGSPFDRLAVTRRADQDVLSLLKRNHLAGSEPILYWAEDPGEMLPPAIERDRWVSPTLWTPALPSIMLNILPDSRLIEYVRRFEHDHPTGGYIVRDASKPLIEDHVLAAITQVYDAREIDRQGTYTLTQYFPKP